jgi:hypothetical protein
VPGGDFYEVIFLQLGIDSDVLLSLCRLCIIIFLSVVFSAAEHYLQHERKPDKLWITTVPFDVLELATIRSFHAITRLLQAASRVNHHDESVGH